MLSSATLLMHLISMCCKYNQGVQYEVVVYPLRLQKLHLVTAKCKFVEDSSQELLGLVSQLQW